DRADGVALELPDRTITLPAAVGVALRELTGPGRHVVGRLAGMDESDQLVLVRPLLRGGVVVPAPGPWRPSSPVRGRAARSSPPTRVTRWRATRPRRSAGCSWSTPAR